MNTTLSVETAKNERINLRKKKLLFKPTTIAFQKQIMATTSPTAGFANGNGNATASTGVETKRVANGHDALDLAETSEEAQKQAVEVSLGSCVGVGGMGDG